MMQQQDRVQWITHHYITIADSDVSMSLFEIRYDYDTIITKYHDYRYDFNFS